MIGAVIGRLVLGPPRFGRTEYPWPLAVLAATLLLVLAAVLGLVASTGSLLLVLPFVGLFALVLIVSVPLVWAMWGLLIAAFLVTGPLIYFGGIESARWMAPGMAALLFLPYALHLIRGAGPFAGRVGLASPLVWYALFVSVLVFGTALSAPRVGELILSSRVYFAYIPVTLLLAAGLIAPDQLGRMWKAIIFLVIVQVPVALIQAFVVAPKRVDQSVAWDAVTGTFPGNPEGGGANAAVSLFVLIASIAALALHRVDRMKGWHAGVICASALVVVLVGEVKAIAFLIPIGLCMLYARELLRRPLLAVGGVVISVLVGAVVMGVYSYNYAVERAALVHYEEVPKTPWESIANQLNPERQQRGRDAGRVFTLIDWAERNFKASTAAELLVGYGAGSTQVGRLGVGEVAQKVPYRTDITASGLLLWDSGLVGHLFFVAMLIAATRMAFRSLRNPAVPDSHRALLHATAVGLLLHAICLPYKDFMFRTPPSQFLLYFLLGYVIYWHRVSRAMRAG